MTVDVGSRLNASIRDLPAPARVRKLRISDQGYYVPWFVADLDGVPDFRIADVEKFRRAVRFHLCWMCGEQIGKFNAFVLGPMCAVNRTTAEPPCHLDCARYAVIACPFLTRPRMRRNDRDLPHDRIAPPGVGLKRNPGAIAIWITRTFELFSAHYGGKGKLFRLGDPTSIEWYAQGRHATRAEILESIDSGFPLLQKVAASEGHDAVLELDAQYQRAMTLLPAV